MNMHLNIKLLVILIWSTSILFSLIVSGYAQYKYSIKIAHGIASATFDKDQAFRQWASSHGGVYVPVDMNRTPPSKYLAHMKDRDIVTPSGKKLTLMNPAYMLRQMIDDYSGLYGTKGHITALEILNPNSVADK